MTEHVATFDLGVTWEPNAPDAVLLTGDLGLAALSLRAHSSDQDRRCVVLLWTGCRYASMTPPNDEAISGHRLWEGGLRDARWAAEVHDSELINELERQNHLHPMHNPSAFAGLRHWVLPLKECVVEVVADVVTVERFSGTTAEAALQASR